MQLNGRILKFLLSSGLILVALALHAQGQDKNETKEETGFVLDKIICKIDNYIVLKSDLDGAYQNYVTEGNPGSEQAKCNLLNRLMMNKLMVAKAEIDSLIVTDSEVDQNTSQRMGVILQNYGNSAEELERQYGKTMEQIKVELRDQIREQLLANEMSKKVTRGIEITPAEVKKFFNKIPSDSVPYYDAGAVIAQIVREAKVSSQQKEEAKARLEDLRNRLLNGENFNELAKKYSEDPSAQANGGEMGYVGRGAMVPEFEAMAFKMRKGEISHPFESPFGFHVMQLIDRRGNEYNSRHILIFAIPSEKDKEKAGLFLDSIRRKIMKDSLKWDYAARTYSDDTETKGHSGYFTDPDGGMGVSLKSIDPAVYLAIDTMKVGHISKPLPYRTDRQKEAMRILYFKSKIPPHQANLKDDWHRIQSAALIAVSARGEMQDVGDNVDTSSNTVSSPLT